MMITQLRPAASHHRDIGWEPAKTNRQNSRQTSAAA
jgi:hypothetical protein